MDGGVPVDPGVIYVVGTDLPASNDEAWVPPEFIPEEWGYASYIEGRFPGEFKVHKDLRGAHSAISYHATNFHLPVADRDSALKNCAVYQRHHSGSWHLIEVYPKGTRLPWRATT
jgi:hypothetical protein